MESLIFLLEKKVSKKVKSRHCANGSVQREWMRDEDTSSPTASDERLSRYYSPQLSKPKKIGK